MKKRKSKRSTTHLSLKLLAKEGWLAGVVERFIPYVNIRKDLFGFIDVIAIRGHMTMGVQVCKMSDTATRLHKIRDNPKTDEAVCRWLSTPTRSIEIQGWDLKGKQGMRKRLTCKRISISNQTIETSTSTL